MKVLAKYLGGSISYGLNTPESDRDERYVYIHTDYSKILGLEKDNFKCIQNDVVDSFGWEIRHFLGLLRNGNTMSLEMMFNNTWIEASQAWIYIQTFSNQLISSHKLFKCLEGYCHSERRLTLGERTGVLGGKRKGHLDTYGYSYKNLVQYLRLCLCGRIFFQDGVFPVNVRSLPEGDLLYSIKTNPGKYSKEDASKLMDEYERLMKESYDSIKVVYEYNEDIANKLCYDLYMPILDPNNRLNYACGYIERV